jgi:hypothetical protein
LCAPWQQFWNQYPTQAPLPTPIAVDVHDASHLESDECAILLHPEQQRGEQAAEIRQMTDDHQVAGFILQPLTPRLDTIVWSYAGNLSRALCRMEPRGHDLCRLPGTAAK